MRRQIAYGFYDSNAKLVSYCFMGDSAMFDIKTFLLKEPYDILYEVLKLLFEGNCLLHEFKSSAFAAEHDLVAAVMILPTSIVSFDDETLVIYRRRSRN